VTIFDVGSENPAEGHTLTRALLRRPGAKRGYYRLHRFQNSNQFIELSHFPEGPATIIFQPGGAIGERVITLGLLADALKRCSAGPVTCILPYLEYSRSHILEDTRNALGAKVFIDLLCATAVDRLVVFDLHEPGTLGMFSKPVQILSVVPLLVRSLTSSPDSFHMVISPDAGRYKQARILAKALAVPIDLLLKERSDHAEASTLVPVVVRGGHLAGRNVVVFDDEILTGTTIVHVVEELLSAGVSSIDIAVIHPRFGADFLPQIFSEYPGLRSVITTNLGDGQSWLTETGLPVQVIDASALLTNTVPNPAMQSMAGKG
jgi:ribose-phosphate pyrophosphokinase